MPYVDYMLALIALAVIWTGTAWYLIDGNAVDVARGASHFNGFFWIVFSAAPSSIDHEHSEIWMSNNTWEACYYSPLRRCSMELLQI